MSVRFKDLLLFTALAAPAAVAFAQTGTAAKPAVPQAATTVQPRPAAAQPAAPQATAAQPGAHPQRDRLRLERLVGRRAQLDTQELTSGEPVARPPSMSVYERSPVAE